MQFRINIRQTTYWLSASGWINQMKFAIAVREKKGEDMKGCTGRTCVIKENVFSGFSAVEVLKPRQRSSSTIKLV